MPRAKQPNPADNRTDLLTPAAPMRKMTAPGQAYGQRAAQEKAMRSVPVGRPNPPATAAAAPQAPTPMQQAPAEAPGELPWLGTPGSGGAPTTGLPRSPGPGPEILGPMGKMHQALRASEQGSLQTLLGHLANQPGASSIVKTLAASANTKPH